MFWHNLTTLLFWCNFCLQWRECLLCNRGSQPCWCKRFIFQNINLLIVLFSAPAFQMIILSGVWPCWMPSSRLLLLRWWHASPWNRGRKTRGGRFSRVINSMWPSQGLTQVTNLPMMITFTFNGAVNDENVRVYDRLFHGGKFMISFKVF